MRAGAEKSGTEMRCINEENSVRVTNLSEDTQKLEDITEKKQQHSHLGRKIPVVQKFSKTFFSCCQLPLTL
ncbi:unnamed protein product, partial [Vitis vinifera]